MMIEVASLRYGVIFKKAFSVPEIFNAFVSDVTGTKIEVEEVEPEKSFSPVIGSVDIKFDLYGHDLKNRIIVTIQHERLGNHYNRLLHDACDTILQQLVNVGSYQPKPTVYTIVVLTSGDRHQTEIAIIDMDPKDRNGNSLGEISHKVIYLAPKYADEKTPEPLREWFRAIDDSLDEQVDEADYEREEIHQIFELIQKDKVSPQERAKMIEEHHQDEIKQKSFEEGLVEGREEGREEGVIQTQQQILIRQLQRKFSELPAVVIALIESTNDVARLNEWLDTLWSADSLADMGLTSSVSA
ncbi:MAG: hypothetical protein AAF639_09450 [Chloroflexota bacterium]